MHKLLNYLCFALAIVASGCCSNVPDIQTERTDLGRLNVSGYSSTLNLCTRADEIEVELVIPVPESSPLDPAPRVDVSGYTASLLFDGTPSSPKEPFDRQPGVGSAGITYLREVARFGKVPIKVIAGVEVMAGTNRWVFSKPGN